MKVNDVKKLVLQNRINLLSERDNEANARIIKKLERQLRKLNNEEESQTKTEE